MEVETPCLSICTTCRDGREALHVTRGGTRLARTVFERVAAEKTLGLRGVRCMSQCKRPCVVSLSGRESFTYVFGDLDPERLDHVDALLEFTSLYSNASEGFLTRQERPEVLRPSILGRFPPIGSNSPLVNCLIADPQSECDSEYSAAQQVSIKAIVS